MPRELRDIVGLFRDIADWNESSDVKSILKENPDWAENPKVQQQLLAASPTLGMGLIDRASKVAEQRQARAGQRLVFMQKADDAAHEAYTKALEGGATETAAEEGGLGAFAGSNYAAADKAGNDVFQRYRLQAEDLYGSGFADKLPQVWKLSDPENPMNGYEGRRPSYERVLDSMREPVNLVFPDGKAATVSLLPHELAKLTRENKGLRVEKIGTSAPVRPGEIGGLDANQRATITGKVGDDYVKASETFSSVGRAFRNMRALENDPSAAGDVGIVYNYMKILDPTSVVREGEVATAQNAASVPDSIRNLYNKAITGERVSVNRADFVNQAERIYKEREREQDALDKGLGFAQRAYNLNDDQMAAIRSRVPRVEAAPRRSAAEPPPQAGDSGELAAARAIVRNPQAPLPEFTGALRKLPDGELPNVNRKALSDGQLQAYVAELKARKTRTARKKGGK